MKTGQVVYLDEVATLEGNSLEIGDLKGIHTLNGMLF